MRVYGDEALVADSSGLRLAPSASPYAFAGQFSGGPVRPAALQHDGPNWTARLRLGLAPSGSVFACFRQICEATPVPGSGRIVLGDLVPGAS